ncbi:hypothetical protein [Streptomyces sp. NRRL F-5123]|uniref:hypothetical protein n=1 Tax=Streptomyces sp. NRRL F-5123 TaxID=1463856 RepID=UPI0004E289A9|nr:hypothetical protein [Streptomyces sp. NRRL F-5123]
MKTTMTVRRIANPRRTTLAHLKDASELTAAVTSVAPDAPAGERPLPATTANPRRTILNELPKPPVA